MAPLIFLLCSILLCTTSAANHEISLQFSTNPIAVASTNASQSIIESEGGEFGLKFRSLNTNSFLLAIVFLHYNETTVWSANRNRPVSRNAQLVLSSDRNLVLKDGDGDGFFIWSANVTGASRMMLNPKGNLLIYNGNGGILWQSFNHPTDTLLPSQTVRTGTFLVSSVSDSNTSESIYMGGVLPGGGGFFALAPQFFPYGILEFNTLRESAREAYMSFYNSSCNHTIIALSDDGLLLEYQQEGNTTQECMKETGGNPYGFSISLATNSSKGFRYIRMEPDGNLKLYLQTPSSLKVEKDFFVDFFNDICRLPNYCGPYGICANTRCTCPAPESSYFSQPDQASAGCKPKEALRCNSSHTLVELRGIDYFPSRYLDPLQVSLDECKILCLSNCSCVAAFYWQSSGSCFHYEELLSMKTVSDQTQLGFIKVMYESVQLEGRGSRFWKRASNIIGVILGAGLLFILILFLIIFALLKKKQHTTALLAAAKGDHGFLNTLSVLPPRFTFDKLKAITRDFSRKLGSGGFGSVYEGVLADGTMVAVKQLEADASQGYGEFRTEIATLGSLSHVNLVRLRGFCAEESHHLLVYEYMANRSLDSWLFCADATRLLSWGTRLSIAIDIARGLAFLHEECRECIVHFDVKPENILLDEKLRAKLSDFGLSKLIDRKDLHSRVLTGRMRGTPGYLAPEWLMENGVGSKSDVYSLGIVLLELLSGRRCVDLSAPADDCYLPAKAMRRFQEAKLMEIVDPRLVDGVPEESEARKVVMVALWCIQEEAAIRPKASAVTRMLEGHIQIHEPPMASLQSALSKQRHICITAALAGNESRSPS